jgi:Cyclin.
MDAEPTDDFDETKIIFQGDNVSYEEAYQLNKFKVVDILKLLEAISNVLGEIIKETDNIPDQFISSFHAKSVPSISIKDYLIRIARCSKCSQECFILALIYIDRLTERTKNFLIKSLNIHR